MSSSNSLQPNFSLPVKIQFSRYNTNDLCTLTSLDNTLSDAELMQITSICSEKIIYERLFQHIDKFKNGYNLDHAKGFMDHAIKGWSENNSFVFLIRDPLDQIVAAIDIKSATLDDAEVGYWASTKYPGVMSNATIQLCELAKIAGYKKLSLIIKLENIKSQNVAKNAGFIYVKNMIEDEIEYMKFEKVL